MADFSDSPRKTLDDIRRELDADYPIESEAKAPAFVAAHDDDAAAVEHPSSRRHARVRRYVTMAALAGVGALVVLIAGSVVASLKPMRPNALASAREIGAPHAVVGNPDREARAARPVAVASPAIPSELVRELKALRSDLKGLADRLDRADSRAAGMESRVQGVESTMSTMRRLADEAATASRRPPRVVAAPPATAKPVAPVVESAPSASAPSASAPSAVPPTAPAPARVIPATAPVPESSTTPSDVRPTVEVVVSSEAPSDVSESRPPSAEPSEPATLRQKLRAEWRTIKRGFAGAGEDVKAILGFGRKSAGE